MGLSASDEICFCSECSGLRRHPAGVRIPNAQREPCKCGRAKAPGKSKCASCLETNRRHMTRKRSVEFQRIIDDRAEKLAAIARDVAAQVALGDLSPDKAAETIAQRARPILGKAA